MIEAQELKQFARMVADELDRRNNQPQFLNEQDAAKLCGLTARSLQEMRYQGSGPPFVKLGDSKKAPIRYDRTELVWWMNTRQRFYSTREAMTGADEDSRHP